MDAHGRARELLGRVAPLGEELADAVVDGLAVAFDADGGYAPPDDTGRVRTEDDATPVGGAVPGSHRPA